MIRFREPKALLVTQAPDYPVREIRPRPQAAADFHPQELGWAAAWAELTGRYAIRHGNDRLPLLKVLQPGASAPCYVIRWDPRGVLLAEETNGWVRDAAFPSLESGLLSICALSGPQMAEAERRAAYWAVQSDRPDCRAGILLDA